MNIRSKTAPSASSRAPRRALGVALLFLQAAACGRDAPGGAATSSAASPATGLAPSFAESSLGKQAAGSTVQPSPRAASPSGAPSPGGATSFGGAPSPGGATSLGGAPSPGGALYPASASAAPSSSRGEGAPSASALLAAKPADPLNKTRPPTTSADLDERASHLLDALVQGDAALADDFFFPKAPFVPLKDVADPARYFDQLLATYHRDVKALRAEQKDWSGATFASFELGTTPTWVAPGKEYNKIGYFRTFGGKLRYRVGDKNKEIAVSTIISWDGRWYVTHLSPIRH